MKMASLLRWFCVVSGSVCISAYAGSSMVSSLASMQGANSTIDPFIQQIKLTAPDGGVNDRLGNSVALSSDGDTAIVGASCATVGGNHYQGAVYVFTRSGAIWTLQAKLTAPDGIENDHFGESVALSGDGNTTIVGAYAAAVGGINMQGAAYVFTRSGAAWTRPIKLIASDGNTNDNFGFSVALSSNGNTAIVGAVYANVGTNDSPGAVYIFTRSGAAWTQQTKLAASDGAWGDAMGYSVALSSDGNTIIAGAPSAVISGHSFEGAAYVFTCSGVVWTQQAKIAASDGAMSAQFGNSLALNSDGTSAIVGAYRAIVGGNTNQGAAYVFARSGTNWSQLVKLTAADGAANDYYGYSVALSSDGNIAIAGAFGANVGGNDSQGAAYVFTRSGDFWTQQAKLTASDGAASHMFGVSMAMSSDQKTFIAGASGATVGGNNYQGAAYVMSVRQAAIGPLIKANGAMGIVPINHPAPVTIEVAMNADIYAGVPVDWWVIAYANNGGGWFYLDSNFHWMSPIQGLLSFCQPVYQGPLFNLPTATILNLPLPQGAYTFWFAVDYPMNGVLNLGGPILYDKVIVIVQ